MNEINAKKLKTNNKPSNQKINSNYASGILFKFFQNIAFVIEFFYHKSLAIT